MAERKVYLGSFNNENKKILQEKAYSYLKENKGDKFYYILPNGDLLKKHRQEFLSNLEATFEMNLFTFDDVVNEIIESRYLKKIDFPIKSLIIRNILKKLSGEGNLVYYNEFVDMKGFAQSCIDIIREIKRSLVISDTYLDNCPNLSFYKEIGLIYKCYENVLIDKFFTDRESDYLCSIEILQNSNDYLINLDYVIIDEFYDFRPVEMAIIKELSKKNIDIFINMPFGKQENNQILNGTVEKLKSIGFEIQYSNKNPINIFEDLGAKLFSNNKDSYDFIENIEITKSPSSYLELKKVFKEVKQKISEGIELEEIGVIILCDSYLDNLSKISTEENLPLSISKTTPLTNLPLIKEFSNLLKTKITNGSKENIINRIKSSYFPLFNQDRKEELEYIVRRLSFNNLEELNSILEDNKNLQIPANDLSHVIQLVDRINFDNQGINDRDKIHNYNRLFLEMLNRFKTANNILNKFSILKDYDIYHRDLLTLEKLKNILLKMDEIAVIQEEMTIEDYYLSFENYLIEESIIEREESVNGLKILNPINARGLSFRFLFIVGLSQEEYPRINNNSFFLSDDNHNILKSIGIDIKDYSERFSNEALKFSTLFSMCRERLYISFNENSQESGNDIPSMFLDEILSRINGDELKEKVVYTNIELDYLISGDIDKVSCEKDFTNTLLYKYYNKEIEDKYIVLHEKNYINKLNDINKITEVQIQRFNDEFNEYRGLLNDLNIKDIIMKDLKDKIYSISYLEAYSKCPYFFLLNNYFNVEEMGRRVEDFNPIDIGTIYHQVLNNYFNIYKDALIANIQTFDVEDTKDNLKELVLKYGSMAGYNTEIKKDLLIIENIYLRLMNFIKEDINRLYISEDNIIPWEFEVEFGKDTPFDLDLNEKKLSLRGKIDRIDKIPDKDYYIVIDYKSSAYGKKDLSHIQKGLSLQLPLYIMSQNHKNVIAGAYSTISDGEFFTAMGILGKASFINKRQKGAMEKEQWDIVLSNTKETIFNIVEKINNGDFSVNPLDCSPYCPFKDICRYEKVMEVE